MLDKTRSACPACRHGRRVKRSHDRAEARVAWLLDKIEQYDPEALDSMDRTQAWLRVLLDRYGLYGTSFEERETAAVREECHEMLGAGETPERAGDCAVADAAEEPPRSPGQCWAELYPLRAPADHGYACGDCGEVAERGWACVECEVFVCYECGAAERHRCNLSALTGGKTLGVIGAELDVSRERVRGLGEQAMRRMAEQFRRAESEAQTKRMAAAYELARRLPDPEAQELLWEHRQIQTERQAEARQRQAEMEAKALQRKEQAAAARAQAEENKRAYTAAQQRWAAAERARQEDPQEIARALWRSRIAQSEQALVDLREAAYRQLALHAASGDAQKLPWRIRYRSAQHQYEFGNSVWAAPTALGICSCAACKRIVLDGSEEAAQHWHGDCAFEMAPPEGLLAQVRRDLGLAGYFAPPTVGAAVAAMVSNDKDAYFAPPSGAPGSSR